MGSKVWGPTSPVQEWTPGPAGALDEGRAGGPHPTPGPAGQYSLGVGALGLGAPHTHVHGHPIQLLAAWLPPRGLDSDDTVGGTDPIARAQGGRA